MKWLAVFFAIAVNLTTFGLDEVGSQIHPPEGYYYVGCRPSFGECQMSCLTRKFWATLAPELCNEFKSPYEKIACYCAPPSSGSTKLQSEGLEE